MSTIPWNTVLQPIGRNNYVWKTGLNQGQQFSCNQPQCTERLWGNDGYKKIVCTCSYVFQPEAVNYIEPANPPPLPTHRPEGVVPFQYILNCDENDKSCMWKGFLMEPFQGHNYPPRCTNIGNSSNYNYVCDFGGPNGSYRLKEADSIVPLPVIPILPPAPIDYKSILPYAIGGVVVAFIFNKIT
jgi:hypothetical protein